MNNPINDPVIIYGLEQHQIDHVISLINDGHQTLALSELYEKYGKRGIDIYESIQDNYMDRRLTKLIHAVNELKTSFYAVIKQIFFPQKII